MTAPPSTRSPSDVWLERVSETALPDIFDDYVTLALGEIELGSRLAEVGDRRCVTVLADLDGSGRARAASRSAKVGLVEAVRAQLAEVFPDALCMVGAGQRDKTWVTTLGDPDTVAARCAEAQDAFSQRRLPAEVEPFRTTLSFGVHVGRRATAFHHLVAARELVAVAKQRGGHQVCCGSGLWADAPAALARGLWLLAEITGPLWYWIVGRNQPAEPEELRLRLMRRTRATPALASEFSWLVEYVMRAASQSGSVVPATNPSQGPSLPTLGPWSSAVVGAAGRVLDLSHDRVLDEAVRLGTVHGKAYAR
jgi:hypothetical protein